MGVEETAGKSTEAEPEKDPILEDPEKGEPEEETAEEPEREEGSPETGETPEETEPKFGEFGDNPEEAAPKILGSFRKLQEKLAIQGTELGTVRKENERVNKVIDALRPIDRRETTIQKTEEERDAEFSDAFVKNPRKALLSIVSEALAPHNERNQVRDMRDALIEVAAVLPEEMADESFQDEIAEKAKVDPSILTNTKRLMDFAYAIVGRRVKGTKTKPTETKETLEEKKRGSMPTGSAGREPSGKGKTTEEKEADSIVNAEGGSIVADFNF